MISNEFFLAVRKNPATKSEIVPLTVVVSFYINVIYLCFAMKNGG